VLVLNELLPLNGSFLLCKLNQVNTVAHERRKSDRVIDFRVIVYLSIIIPSRFSLDNNKLVLPVYCSRCTTCFVDMSVVAMETI
jgi:hypothetical protein